MSYDEQKEIDEAIQAINQTLHHLYDTREYLNSAGNWGIFDMLGGGLISTFVKHEKIDDAKAALENAKLSVVQLKKELSDIQREIQINLDMDDFLVFADYFFDGLIADWLVQSKINDCKYEIESGIRSLEDLKRYLVHLKD